MRFSSIVLPIFVTVAILGSAPLSAQDFPLFNRLFGGAPSANTSSAPKGKRVDINLTDQRLKAYEGNRLVMQTKISSGKNRGTPTGKFRAGPYKNKEHYSSLYHNAPMPYSTQITGHIFIHGFSVVPNYPASHGCIRVPVSGRNPARRLFNWLDVGTPIHIHY